MVKIKVDGKFIEAPKGSLLIDVLLENDINIPHFCYHKALGKDGNCRMCMVEIEGQKRPQIACDTFVSDGQIVRTKGEKIEKVKRSILELELINHPIDCPICDQAGECKLQDYYMNTGLYESRLNTSKQKGQKHVDLGANVMLDQERCVLCTRCVRFTKDITKTGELGVLQRADHSVITTFPGTKLSNPYAMNVVDLCPVGALTSDDFRFNKRVWFLTSDEIVCNGCSKVCSIYSDHHKEKYGEDMIYRYRPRFSKNVNGYFICDEGRLSYKKENSNRNFENLVSNKNNSFDDAVKKVKTILKDIYKKKIFVIGANLSIEEMYILNLTASHFNAKIIVSTHELYDDSFGDDFLKENDLALNRNGAKVLDLEMSDKSPRDILAGFDMVAYVGVKDTDRWMKAAFEMGLECGVISPFYHEEYSKLSFLLSCASHTEKEGSFLNCDNILQKSRGRIYKNNQARSIIEICSILGDLPCRNYDEIWQSGRMEAFEHFERGSDE